MAKTKKLRQVRLHESTSKLLDVVRDKLPIKPSIESLVNSALTLGLRTISKTNNF